MLGGGSLNSLGVGALVAACLAATVKAALARTWWQWSLPLDGLLAATMLLHLVAAPYTKVEESFNTQATHDFLFHQDALDKYDHNMFPGVVPRSFLGALLVSAVAAPFHLVAQLSGASRFASQYIARLILGCLSVGASSSLRAALDDRFGQAASVSYVLITVAQFHLPFYWSRPLPNTIALVLTTLGFAYWVRGHSFAEVSASERPRCRQNLRTSIGLLTAAAVVFRCDVVILLAMCCLFTLIISPRLSISELLATGLRWGLTALALTIALDSIVWKRLLWPELEVRDL